MNIQEAKGCIDKIIKKARVHLYKPIQIAEILYRDRVIKDIDLAERETYRNSSKKWRDAISLEFLGRTSTSSAKYQDDLFNQNAIPPEALTTLGLENRTKSGIVEAYIYQRFLERFSQLSNALHYTQSHNKQNFQLEEFIDSFRKAPGLKRSIDKIYEIVVYALFATIIESIDLKVQVSYKLHKAPILQEFKDFAQKVILLNPETPSFEVDAKIYRVGVTNAADRGLDMWANFGLAIQIKHLSLSEEMASNIVGSISADRIVIVCKKAEQKVIMSLLNQIGWKARIQAIVTEDDLVSWYEKAMRGTFSTELGDKIIEIISKEIEQESPTTAGDHFASFYEGRGYHKLHDALWLPK